MGWKSHCYPLVLPAAPTSLPAWQGAPPGHGSLPKRPRLPPPWPPAAISLGTKPVLGSGAASPPRAQLPGGLLQPPLSQGAAGLGRALPVSPMQNQSGWHVGATSPCTLSAAEGPCNEDPLGTQGKKQHPRAWVPGRGLAGASGPMFQGDSTDRHPQVQSRHRQPSMPSTVCSPGPQYVGNSPGHSSLWSHPGKSSSSHQGKGQSGT